MNQKHDLLKRAWVDREQNVDLDNGKVEKSHKTKSLRQLVRERTGMDFDDYLKNNPYDYKTDYIEVVKTGNECI